MPRVPGDFMAMGVKSAALIRDVAPGDFEAICALNLEEVRHTSPMDEARAALLHGLSCYHRVACVDGAVAGFLLAMCSGAPYENENFAWFAQHYALFVYIDRVIVGSRFRGLRVGTLLYQGLFAYARRQQIPVVTCEYNLVPPNEPSRLFHAKFGFEEQGTQWVAGGAKRVSLLAATSRG